MKFEAYDALVKFAEEIVEYDRYGMPIRQTKPSSPIPATLLGGVLGGLSAHYLLPSTKALVFREQLKKMVGDAVASRALRSQALEANAPRMLGGVGAGLLAGYLGHRFLS